MGKLTAYQKGLKRFLFHKLKRGRDQKQINRWIAVYDHWYNNEKYHFHIDTYPEVGFSGKRDSSWYERFVKALKLENLLTISRKGLHISLSYTESV
jgi:hypothetical protein